MYTIWADWTATNGTWLYPGLTVGAEGLDAWSVTGKPYREWFIVIDATRY